MGDFIKICLKDPSKNTGEIPNKKKMDRFLTL